MEVGRALIGLMLLTAATEAQPCVIIESVGFRNAAIQTGPHGLRPARTFRFKAGTAWNGDADPAAHDWQASIKRDVVLRPEPGYSVRFLTVLDTHVADGATELYLLGFECDDGEIKRVLDESGEHMRVERLASREIVLAFTTREVPPKKGDIVDVRRVRFSWDASRHAYVRREAARPPPDFKVLKNPRSERADTLRRPHMTLGTAETTAFVRGRPYRGIRSPFDWLPLETQWPRSIELPSPRITMAPRRRGGLVPNSRLPNSQFHFILGCQGIGSEDFCGGL